LRFVLSCWLGSCFDAGSDGVGGVTVILVMGVIVGVSVIVTVAADAVVAGRVGIWGPSAPDTLCEENVPGDITVDE